MRQVIPGYSQPFFLLSSISRIESLNIASACSLVIDGSSGNGTGRVSRETGVGFGFGSGVGFGFGSGFGCIGSFPVGFLHTMIITKSMMMMTNSSTITISVSAFSIIQSMIDGFGAVVGGGSVGGGRVVGGNVVGGNVVGGIVVGDRVVGGNVVGGNVVGGRVVGG